MLHGARGGALREELQYFANCILEERAPTVITPEEALDCFLRTRMDLLVLGDFMLVRSEGAAT
jgi:hypothetical protein